MSFSITIEVGRVALRVGRLNMVSGEPLGMWVAWSLNPAVSSAQIGRIQPKFLKDRIFIVPGTGTLKYRGEPVDR